ncbi:MAG: PEP-CTERM sorting domain-containing protein [Isosphaeraceae bacterium]
MSPNAVMTLIVLVAIAPSASADILISPTLTATLTTNPNLNPPVSLVTNPSMSVVYNVPSFASQAWLPLGSFSQVGISFDLANLPLSGPNVPACKLIFTNLHVADTTSPGFYGMTAPITYGLDSSAGFSEANFFQSNLSPAPSGTAGVLIIPRYSDFFAPITLDITGIVRAARSDPNNRYLKFWVHPSGTNYWALLPNWSVVPEPTSALLLGLGISVVTVMGRFECRPVRRP